MGRKATVETGMLHTAHGDLVAVETIAWQKWLQENKKFFFKGKVGRFSARKEGRPGGMYWYGYRRRDGKLHKVYLGKSEQLTLINLEKAAADLAGNQLDLSVKTVIPAEAVPDSFAQQAKIRPTTLPPNLVTRTRLTDQMQTPVTIISAPGGYGKSTLLNTWRQVNPTLAVAWATLDADDDRLKRFWMTIIMALQAVHPLFGETQLAYLQRHPNLEPAEIAVWITNSLRFEKNNSSRIGLVLDNFHYIKQPEIHLSLQSWFDHLPVGLQLIIASRTRPPLALGRLRAMGIVTELEQDDLRFTLTEGIDFLKQHFAEQPLAYNEMERLVKRTGGWVAGLKLAAMVLNKQRDQQSQVDTFSGTHLYVREYFLETALHQQTEAVQTFLVQTSILKQLTGALCDAVTGRTDGAQMLAQLWQENLFLSRGQDQAWYQYHDLFAEMLHNQLQLQQPDKVANLHRRAASWYLQQNASADAVRHLMAIDAWEEAAVVIEEVALRHLVEYGEDSRLLRWILQLPETVFRHHKTLLFTYLRLARMALSSTEIERVLNRLENDLTSIPHAQLTHEQQEVLATLRPLRGNPYRSLFTVGQDARWQLIDSLKVIEPYYVPRDLKTDAQTQELYEQARRQGNLFVILLAGAICASHAYFDGQLQNGENIAQQALTDVLAHRGVLPEPASAVLDPLCKICIARDELTQAQQLLQQATEVDANPTSSNMPVSLAIVRGKLQAASGDSAAARVTVQGARALHMQHPSNAWRDSDLAAYEAMFCLPSEDWTAVERLLGEVGESDHALARLVRAEMLLRQGKASLAEPLLRALLQQPVSYEPTMQVRVLLAWALYDQHKLNQASQVLMEAIRLAIPERFARPFLDYAKRLLPLFALLQHTESVANKVKQFITEILQASGEQAVTLTDFLPQESVDLLAVAASITERELEVLRLTREGCSNQEIGRRLYITKSTVKTHLANIFRKLGVHNRVQAVTIAQSLKLFS